MDALVRRSLGRAIRAGAGESALRDEQMSRSRQFFDDGQDRIEGAFVVVVGMGGVGSHAANMMVRGGLGRLRCIDFDNVSLSSLNRHATATRAEVGEPKVKAFRDHLLKVCPWCEIEAVSAIFRGEDADRLLAGKPDLVIDCIDDTATKAQLLMACDRLGLECVSSLGAGGKSDPTRIHVAQLDDCVVDPLASKLRYRLRYEIREQLCAKEAAGSASAPAKATETAAEGPPAPSAKPAVTAAATDTASGPASTLEADRAHDAVVTEIASRILTRTHAVYSSERPVKSLMPLAEAQAENPDQFGLLAGFRLRIIPVLGTMPALLGQAIAGHALCLLAKKPIREPFVAPRQGLAAVTSMTNKCRGRERRTFKSEDHSTINSRVTNGVCEFHYNHVWLARCALDGTPPGSKARLLLRRWYSSKPACLDNLILVDDRVASRLDEEGTGWVPEELKRKVEGRLAWVRAVASADKRGDEDSARQMELALARAGVETVEELTAVAPARVEAAKPVSEDEWLWTGLYLGCGIVVGAVGALSVRQ
jgi:tRNA A37 threonylcarbamoyladenosine dehydratase